MNKTTIIKKTANFLIVTMMIISMVVTSAVTAPVNAASVPKAPAQVTGVRAAANSTSQITVRWNQIKKNKNTNGYEIYRNGKYLYRTSVKAKYYVNKKLKAGTKYTYKVRAFKIYKQKQYYNSRTKKWQNTKPAKRYWNKCPKGTYRGKRTRIVALRKYGKFSKTISVTTKRPTVKGIVVKNNNKNSSTTHTHEYTRPASKNPTSELLKGKCHEVCATCGAERILYAKWTVTEPARAAWSRDVMKNMRCIRIDCRTELYGFECPYHGTEKYPHKTGHFNKNGDWEDGENIYLIDGSDDEKIVEEYNHLMKNTLNWEFSNLSEIINYVNIMEEFGSDPEYNIIDDWEANKGSKYKSIKELCTSNNYLYEENLLPTDYLAILRRINTVIGFRYKITHPIHQFWDVAWVDVYDYTEHFPATKEKGYWDFTKGSYTASNVGWTSTLLTNKELAYGNSSYQF